jgi:actin-like ATPase involved in cell morphogenesis
MNENTPDTIGNKETPTDIILYLRSIKKEINELDNNIIVIFKDEYNNKVGKMEYTKYKSKLQGELNILTSYDFKEIEEELNNYQTVKSPIVTIDEYIQKLI